ncbi:MAG TPA: glutathione S-transferase family protein [Paracoccaceae bacterium]
MTLTLYLHPLASFCHKVLIALYENGTPFVPVTVDLADPDSSAPLLAEWPLGKIPLLVDAARRRTIPETSIIIEYLDRHYPGPVPMLPAEAEARLQTRLWDRFFDLYISQPVQKIVIDRLRPAGAGDPQGVAEARAMLATAYRMIDAQLTGRTWAAGPAFGMADCAAAPALFYAAILQPFDDTTPGLAAYFERLMARPSVARTIDEARPFFAMFPYREAIPPRFLAASPGGSA